MSEETRPNAVASTPNSHDKIEAKRDSSLETELDNLNLEIECSLDPAEVRIRTTHLSAEQIITQIRNGEIYWDSEIQRSFAWQPDRQSRFIESLLLRIPIPVFYVAEDESNRCSVVDGIQRLSAIFNYVTDRFPLNRLEYFDELNGKRYGDLARPMQRRIDLTQLVLHIVEAGTSENVRLNICRRINARWFDKEGQLASVELS